MKNRLFFIAAVVVAFLNLQAYGGLVAYWDFNEASGTILHDRTGHGNDGTIYGASWAPGLTGSSLYFNGTSDYVALPNPLPFELQHFTVTCWVNPQDPYVVQERAFFNNVKAVSGVSDGFIIRFNSRGLNFCVARADNMDYWLNIDASVTFSPGSFHFAACTYDGATMVLYFDGVRVGQAPYSGGIRYTSVNPYIGAAPNNSGHEGYFMGNIDEMRVYDQALSPSELLALYNYRGQTIIADFLIPVPSPTYNRLPLFLWHAVKGASGYNILVDTTRNFTSPIISTATSDTSFMPSVNLPFDTIFWRVMAGVNDTLTYFSDVGSFLIQDPKVPLLIPYVPKVTLERKPVLKWHPVAGASSYTIEIGNDAGFINNSYIIPLSDTQYSPTVNLPFGETYWRVQSSLAPAWSAFDMFQIVPDSIPLLIRYNGTVVSTTQPSFVWHPVVGATSFTIEIANNASFTGGYVVPVTDTSFAPLVALSNGVWFWRVSSSRNPALFCPSDSLVIKSVLANAGQRATAVPFAVRSYKSRIEITADFSINANVEITLFTAAGKKVLERCVTACGRTVSLDAVEVPAGIYLMEIVIGEKSIRQKVLLAR
jgi:hypothetical protein